MEKESVHNSFTAADISDTAAFLSEQTRVRQFQRNKWFFSLGGIGRDMAYALVGTFLLTYLQFGVSLTLAQFSTLAIAVGVIGRIWDGINDPLMGSLIENTHFKWGKFKPWIFFGALFTGVFILGMFNIRFSGWGFVVYIIVVYLFWETAFTMNDVGYWSMMPSLTSVKCERDQLSMLTVAFAAVGAILANAVFSLFSAGNVVKTYRTWSIVIVLVFIGCQTMTAFCCRETPRELGKNNKVKKNVISIQQIFTTLKRNDQALWSGLSLLLYYISNGLLITLAYNLYYVEVGYDGNVFYFVIVYGIANVLSNFFYPIIARFLSRKKILTITAAVASVGYLFIFAMGWASFFPFTILTFALFGFFVFSSNTLFYMASIVNFTNCVEYNEYITGERNEALISTMRSFVAKLSDATKYGIQILILALSGIYLISQGVSTIESQKNFVSGMENTALQVSYVESVQSYLLRFKSGESEESIQTALDNDEILKQYQLTASHLSAVGDCHISRTAYNSDGTVQGEAEDLGKIAELDTSMLISSVGDTNYRYELLISGDGFNAGNENFRDKVHDNIGARLLLRAAVTILPILFMLGSLWLQRKKFFIDEAYYEKMLAELNSRHTAALNEN